MINKVLMIIHIHYEWCMICNIHLMKSPMSVKWGRLHEILARSLKHS